MKRYLYLAAVLLTFAACSNDDSVEGTDENVGGTDELVELRLTGSVEVQSRATHGLDEQFAAGETVHVWVDDAGLTESAELYEDNILTVGNDNYTLSGGETMYFPSTGNGVDIYAIHGNFGSEELSSFWDTAVTHSVEQDQQSSVTETGAGYAVSDLVYCSMPDVERTRDAVELTFQHLLSKVEVVLKQGNGAPTINRVEIINTQLQAEFTPSKESGVTVAAAGDAGENAIVIDCDVTDAESETLNEGIIVPQTLESGTEFIRITTDEGGELVYSLDKATTFAAGKKYHYIITVKLTGLEVTASVDNWEQETDDVYGDAEMGDDYTYTEENGTRTYTVYTEAGLQAWSEYTRSGNWYTNCTLGANITLSEPEEEGGSNWIAVGENAGSTRYYGTFDGNGYTITGLTMSASSAFYQGLIGCLAGEVKNLKLADVSISDGDDGHCIGAVAGGNRGTVTDCHVSGTVSGADNTGGVVGWNNGTITGCTFSGEVNGTSHLVAGVAGYNNGSIIACYATGKVSGPYETGGVVGGNKYIVTSCYFAGAVSGESEIGGVAGSNTGAITACYWYNDASYGIGSSESNEGATYVDDDEVTWAIAVTAMNEMLDGYSWNYEENTGDDADSVPLILVATATE